MGVRCGSLATSVLANALPANGVETIVFQLPPMVLATDGAQVILGFSFMYTPGTGTTSHSFRLRRGNSLSSPSLGYGAWASGCSAGYGQIMSGTYFDQPTAGEPQYCLTLLTTGTSVAGTFTDGCLLAFVL